MNWWGTRLNPSPRMVVEIGAMKKLFNLKKPVQVTPNVSWDQQFYLETLERELHTEGSEPYWLITFRMYDESWSRIRSKETYTIRITYKRDFPAKEPWVTVPSRDVSDSHHRYGEHQDGDVVICLHGHSANPRSEWDPGRSTAATLGLWAIEWIRAYLLWKEQGYWPDEA